MQLWLLSILIACGHMTSWTGVRCKQEVIECMDKGTKVHGRLFKTTGYKKCILKQLKIKTTKDQKSEG